MRTNWNGKPYYSLDYYLKETFGRKVYKLALDGGMTCPNRDGTLGTGGCIFCSEGGSGDFAQKRDISVRAQVDAAKSRVSKKMNQTSGSSEQDGPYIAYFQSYTNTYAPLPYLESLFSEAVALPEICAVSIGTRPDCLPEPVLSLLAELSHIKPVYVEFGLQTSKQTSIAYINRCYENAVFENAVRNLHKLNIPVIVHCILGLPYETPEDMQNTIDYVCSLPVHGIKLQLLHVLKDTGLAHDYEELSANHAFSCMERDAYFNMIATLLPRIPSHIVIYRLTGDGPRSLLIAPLWSTDKKRVQNDLQKLLKEKKIIQGGMYPCNPNP